VFLNKLQNVPFRHGATYTDKALVLANGIVTNRSNLRPSGMYKRNFVFVLTDGMSNNRENTASAARQLQRHAQIIAIGEFNIAKSGLQIMIIYKYFRVSSEIWCDMDQQSHY